MRSLAAAALAVTALAASAAPAHATSCPVEIEWNGDTYAGVGDQQAVRGRLLGTGVIAVCEDHERVPIHAVRGVEPRFAITGAGHERGFFLNTAYPVRLREHPLHELFWGHRRWPTCRPTRHLTAVGEFESLHDVLRVEPDRGPSAFFVDDRTRMVPRLGRLLRGDRIRVEAAECRFAGGPSIPFARRLTVVARASPAASDRDPSGADVARAAAITAAIFAVAFGVRALRRGRRAAATG